MTEKETPRHLTPEEKPNFLGWHRIYDVFWQKSLTGEYRINFACGLGVRDLVTSPHLRYQELMKTLPTHIKAKIAMMKLKGENLR